MNIPEIAGVLHKDLLAMKELLLDSCNLVCSSVSVDLECEEYGGYAFKINCQQIRFRVAKITPKKVGHFVTLWKRIGQGPIQPYDAEDDIDLIVISTRKDEHFGQFIFPKSILLKKNIFSTNGKGGKRGIRVYPPWETVLNQQAHKTQQWQSAYFLEFPVTSSVDCVRANMLYGHQESS